MGVCALLGCYAALIVRISDVSGQAALPIFIQKKIPCRLRNPKLDFVVHKRFHLYPILFHIA